MPEYSSIPVSVQVSSLRSTKCSRCRESPVLPNNTILLDFDEEDKDNLEDVVRGAQEAATSQFNVLILRSNKNRFGYHAKIHLWLTDYDLSHTPLMLLLAYIIVGHPEWKNAEIRLFACFGLREGHAESERLSQLLEHGRLPITKQNVEVVECKDDATVEREVGRRSDSARPADRECHCGSVVLGHPVQLPATVQSG